MISPEAKAKKSAWHKANYIARKERLMAYGKTYYTAHKAKIAARTKAYLSAHPEAKARKVAYFKAWRETHKDEYRTWGKAYRQRPEVKERDRARLEIHREVRLARLKAAHLRRNYGLTNEKLNDILINQGGTCAICKKANWNGKRPHVDHDHVAGKVRGLLCNSCNTALGMIKDDPAIARAMSDYLENHKGGMT